MFHRQAEQQMLLLLYPSSEAKHGPVKSIEANTGLRPNRGSAAGYRQRSPNATLREIVYMNSRDGGQPDATKLTRP